MYAVKNCEISCPTLQFMFTLRDLHRIVSTFIVRFLSDRWGEGAERMGI
jgi:hypothetical protein